MFVSAAFLHFAVADRSQPENSARESSRKTGGDILIATASPSFDSVGGAPQLSPYLVNAFPSNRDLARRR